jgi:uncharacterized protein (TIGR02996 family)
MNHERDFLAAIAGDSENDALRLIYADWLEDQGDARCEYVRAMCELLNGPQRKDAARERLLLAVADFHAIGDLDWALQIARRVDVILHTVDRPLLLLQLMAEIRRITNLNDYNAIDLVRGMPNNGRFRSDPRRVIQVTSAGVASDLAWRLRQCGATVTTRPATELIERVNLGLGVRNNPALQAGLVRRI